MTTPHQTAPIVWAGSYTAEAGGTGLGITPLARDADGTLAVAGPAHPSASPTWVEAHPLLPVLYATHETSGTVSAFTVSTGGTDAAALAPLGETHRAGDAVCHLSVDPEGRFAIAACWGDGALMLHPLAADGSLGAGSPAAAAADPHPDDASVAIDPHTSAPRRSRAHASLLLDAAHVVSTDLGYDLLRFWRLEEAGRPARGFDLEIEQELVLPAGSGPRHLAALPDGRLLVITEYSIQLIVVDRPHPDAPYRIAASYDLLPEAPRPGESGSGIALADDARTVYLAVRGSDRIVPVRVQPDGSFDVLTPFASGGEIPRAVAVDGLRLQVMHQGSGNVTSHLLDAATGLPTGPAGQTPVPSATTLAFPRWSATQPHEAPTAPASASLSAPGALLTPEGEAFVTDYHLATLATLRTDGSPHQVPVGFTLEGRTVRIITSGTSQKVLNVRRGGRASVSQVERARWLSFEGPARILDDPDSVADAVRRYAARYREPRPNPLRVVIEITVERAMASSGLLLEP